MTPAEPTEEEDDGGGGGGGRWVSQSGGVV